MERVNVAAKLKIWPAGQGARKVSLDQFLIETKPDVYNSVKLMLFEEKKINDIYEEAVALENEN
jgi:hypothetical protein